MAQSVASLVGMCCVLGGLALTVDHRTPTGGCSATDLSKFTQHFDTQQRQFSTIQPQLQEAVQNSDLMKATALMNRITPKFCGQADLLQTDTFPPQVKFSALQKCIRKSQGVSVGCASCFPKYLESMMGKNGGMAPNSCMAKCSKVTPTTAQCLAKMQDPHALKACLGPDVKKNSIPCLQCSKPRLVEYTGCLNMGFLNAEVQLNSIITTIKGEKPVAILAAATAEKAAVEPVNGTKDTKEEAQGEAPKERDTRGSHQKRSRRAQKHHHK